MAEPHNYAKVGYSMILVAASLVVIALVGIAIGEDVLYADKIQRANTVLFEECKLIDFKDTKCEKFHSYLNNDVAKIYVDLEDGS